MAAASVCTPGENKDCHGTCCRKCAAAKPTSAMSIMRSLLMSAFGSHRGLYGGSPRKWLSEMDRMGFCNVVFCCSKKFRIHTLHLGSCLTATKENVRRASTLRRSLMRPNVLNSNFTDGWVFVSIVGDITGPNGVSDGMVDMMAIGYIAAHFLADPGQPKNPDPLESIFGRI